MNFIYNQHVSGNGIKGAVFAHITAEDGRVALTAKDMQTVLVNPDGSEDSFTPDEDVDARVETHLLDTWSMAPEQLEQIKAAANERMHVINAIVVMVQLLGDDEMLREYVDSLPNVPIPEAQAA